MKNAQVKIRQADIVDLESLVSLLKVLFFIEEDFVFDEKLQQAGLKKMLESKRASVLVAEVDGLVVGMCSGQLTISTAEGGPALLVEDVVVQEDCRGQGIGRMLMDEMILWCGEQGISRLQLLADRNNTNALEFYTKLGWKVTELICLRKRL